MEGAAADKIVGNDFEQPFYGWPEGRISWKRFVTIQTVLAESFPLHYSLLGDFNGAQRSKAFIYNPHLRKTFAPP